ncbi:MAG TPA: hypothetical protein VK905_04640 [Bacillota bacterium]|nr:hypothetical protein [Bacillota bacterium]
MKHPFLKVIVIAVAVAVVLTGCTPSGPSQAELEALQTANTELTNQVAALTEQVNALEETLSASSAALLPKALAAIALIQDEDFAGLAMMVHPDGLRFSPYGYVDIANDLVFTAAEVALLPTDTTLRTWGSFDGSGLPIELAFAAYYDRFVYDQDFANPHFIGINNIIGMGNTLINLADVYPDGEFVEFHFSGFDPQYEGMDWRSLRLVFEEVAGEWVLIGIVHDEWTI